MDQHDYIIEKCGDKWCLYNKAKTRVLGRHDSKEGAERQETAIKANEQSYSLFNREIFSVGEHNGDKYTDADLVEMANAFNSLDFLPAIKLGHQRDIGAPAYGYVSNVRKVGTKLLADFIHLPKEIYDAIKQRRYARVSAEVFWNLKRAGKLYKRAIGAVALLGQEIPGVAGLKPLYEHSLTDEYESQLNYALIDDDYDYALQLYDAKIIDDKALNEYATGNIQAVVKAWSDWTGGNFSTCVSKIGSEPGIKDPQALCAWLHKKATGKWPSDKKTFGVNEMSETILKEYKDQLDSMSALIVELQSKVDAGDTATKAYKQQLETSQESLKVLQSQMRDQEVKKFSDSITIPALRPFLAALYRQTLIDGTTKLKVYSIVDGKPKDEEMTQSEIIQKVVDFVNEKGSFLFKEYAQGDGRRTGGYDDPADEVDKRTKKYMLDNKVEDYAAAMRAVLDADDDLKSAYNGI